MISQDTKPGTKVYRQQYDHDVLCDWVEESIVHSWCTDPGKEDYFFSEPFPAVYRGREEYYLTRREAAARCLNQHLEILGEVQRRMAVMLSLVNGVD